MTPATAQRAVWIVVIGAVVVLLLVALALSALGRAPEIFEYETLATNLLKGRSLVYPHNGQLYQAFPQRAAVRGAQRGGVRLTAHRHVFLR